MKAVFSPGPSYSDPEVRKYAGWWHILELYRQAIEELGFDTFVPNVPHELIDSHSTVSKITSYDLVATSQIREESKKGKFELFLGSPGYSLSQMFSLPPEVRKFLYVWNNCDWWRDQQLVGEYAKFHQPYDLSPAWRWINRTALETCDHVIACSPLVKKTHSKVVPEEKISISFWGVDSKRFVPPPVEPSGFNVLFVGGDPIRKGLVYLLEAIEGVDAELWIVGPPHLTFDREFQTGKIKQFGMLPHVDMLKIYQQCHVICIPTLEDGIALAIQESMACGLVPITSPETAEVFTSGVEGFSVSYRDVETLRNRLLVLQGDMELKKKMSLAARKKAESQTWEMTKEEVKRIIRERTKIAVDQ